MKRTTIAAFGITAVVTASLAAQTAPQPAQPTRTETTQTLTGCLKPWDATTMGAPEVGAALGQPFVLTNVKPGISTGVSTPGAPVPPSGSPAITGAHTTYLLKSQSSLIDLAGHANHQVEVTGTITTDATPLGMAMPGATPPAGSTGAARPWSSLTSAKTTFTVTALKMVDKTCS